MTLLPGLPAVLGAGIAGIAALATPAALLAQFEDPRPPAVHKLEKIAISDAVEYPELESFAEPRSLTRGAVTTDWPGFLGPNRNSHSRETMLLKKWPKSGPKLLWSMRRGEGYASPVIVGNRCVFTHRVGGRVHVDCLHTETGKRFWRFSYATNYRGKYITNSGPRATPVISDGMVYVHGIQNSLHCLELTSGRVVWQRDLVKELGAVDDFFGACSSPLIVGDLLINNLSAQKLGKTCGPTVVAFHKKTGRLVWGTGTKWAASCSSPVLGKIHGRERVFVIAGGESRPPVGGLMVLEPKSGKLEFEYPYRSRLFASVTGASPLIGKDWVMLTTSYSPRGSVALTLKKDGGYEQRWKNRSIGLQFSNPILVGNHIYAIDGVSNRPGAIVCIDPKNGEELSRTDLNWDETIQDGGRERRISASIGEGSLLYADGDVLCLGDQGHLLWLKVDPKGTRVLARSWLFKARESWTPLALSRGLLYVCQNNEEHFGTKKARLLCYDLRGGS